MEITQQSKVFTVDIEALKQQLHHPYAPSVKVSKCSFEDLTVETNHNNTITIIKCNNREEFVNVLKELNAPKFSMKGFFKTRTKSPEAIEFAQRRSFEYHHSASIEGGW